MRTCATLRTREGSGIKVDISGFVCIYARPVRLGDVLSSGRTAAERMIGPTGGKTEAFCFVSNTHTHTHRAVVV